MTMLNPKGLLMDKWHKTPNSVIDSLVGQVISANAGWIVLTVIRYTDGFGSESAPIPTGTFMRVLGTKRKPTAYQYIDEAVASGLINVVKETGKVNVFSLNKKCPLWYAVAEIKETKPVSENDTTKPVSDNDTSNGNVNGVVAESVTATSSENRYSYKDNNKEIYIKKYIYISEQQISNVFINRLVEKPKPVKKPSKRDLEIKEVFDTWVSLTGQKIKLDAKRKSNINARLENGYSLEQIKQAMSYVANSQWHKANGQVRLELVVRSNEQLDQQLIKANAPTPNNPLAVNQNWKNADRKPLVANATSLEDFFA